MASGENNVGIVQIKNKEGMQLEQASAMEQNNIRNICFRRVFN